MLDFEQVDITGSRLVGAITELGHIGPKHHGIIIGCHPIDRKIYVAENRKTGYQLATVDDFVARYSSMSDVHIFPNNGKFSDVDVAKRALEELNKGGEGLYNLAVNNCESFSNRAMHDISASTQVINTAIGVAVLLGAVWYIKKAK